MWSFKKIPPKHGSHPRSAEPKSLGVGAGHEHFLKAPQMILMCSPGREPLDPMTFEGLSFSEFGESAFCVYLSGFQERTGGRLGLVSQAQLQPPLLGVRG